MSQLKQMQDSRQQRIEDQLASLGTLMALLEHDGLRVRQAIERTGEMALLEPVLDDFGRAIRAIRRISDRMREDWETGQQNRWDP